MATILDRIVARKRQEIESARSQIGVQRLERLLDGCAPVHDFRAALDRPGQIQIIAEVKKASPSAGILREDFDPVGIARVYAAHGAAAVSVLTDEPFFQGTLAHLSAIRAAVSLPILRKDFVLDRYQLVQARIAGADAVLLIAEILPGPDLQKLLHQAWELGLEATSARTFSLTEINHNVIILSKLYTAERYLSRGRSIIQPLFHFKGDADDTL